MTDKEICRIAVVRDEMDWREVQRGSWRVWCSPAPHTTHSSFVASETGRLSLRLGTLAVAGVS